MVWPLVELVRAALAESGALGSFDPSRTASAVTNTLLIGFSVAVLSVLLGVGAAFLTERSSFPAAQWFRLAVLLPILVPPFVSALSWASAYGPGGAADDAFGLVFPGLFGIPGIVVVLVVNALPLAYVLTVAALRSQVDLDLERAARISGASRATGTRSITLPLLATSIAGTTALVFVLGINAFGVPAVLGTPAGVRTVTTQIYQDLALSARPEAFSRAIFLASGLVVFAVALVALGEYLLSGSRTAAPTMAASGPVRDLRNTRRAKSLVAWAAVIAATVVPLITLILVSITRGVGLAPTPDNWTVRNYAEAFDGRLFSALLHSVLLAAAAATLAVTLGSAVALIRRRRFGRISGAAVMLTFAVPGSTLAVGILLAYGSLLRDTLVLILVAYVAKFWAIGHRAVEGSSGHLSPQLNFAARISGATPYAALRTVVIPLLRPALIGGWSLVFLLGFHELTMSSILYGPGTETLAVSVLNLQQLGDTPVTSALAVILTVPLILIAGPALFRGRLPRRETGTG